MCSWKDTLGKAQEGCCLDCHPPMTWTQCSHRSSSHMKIKCSSVLFFQFNICRYSGSSAVSSHACPSSLLSVCPSINPGTFYVIFLFSSFKPHIHYYSFFQCIHLPLLCQPCISNFVFRPHNLSCSVPLNV